jgi:inorganic pyrophosphatase
VDDRFWRGLDELVAAHPLKVDRPQGSAHPRYPAVIYPLDYGYLEGTQSGDGDGVDVWVGSLPEKQVTGIVCTVDADQRDVEVKVLLGCSPGEARRIVRFHNEGAQAAMLVERKKPGFQKNPVSVILPIPGQ